MLKTSVTISDVWKRKRTHRSSLSLHSDDIPSLIQNADSYQKVQRLKFLKNLSDKTQDLKLGQSPTSSGSHLSSKLTVFKEKHWVKRASLYIIDQCIQNLLASLNVHNANIEIYHAEPLMYKTLHERFGQVATIYDSFVVGSGYTDSQRIQKEMCRLIFVLREIWDEVDIFSDVRCLKVFIKTHCKLLKEENELLSHMEMKKERIKELLLAFSLAREAEARKNEDLDLLIKLKKVELAHVSEHLINKVRYTKDWENSRYEQNSRVLFNKEMHYKVQISGLDKQSRNEKIVHDDICLFHDEARKELLCDIEKFMEKYDRDLEEKEVDIWKLKSDMSRIESTIENVRNVFEKRKQEIQQWLTYKKNKREEENRHILRSTAAVTIQEWWRKIMKEKKLGAHGKKKKSKKSEKKNKKQIEPIKK